MAQRVNIELVDDLDGTKAVETVAFGIDGTHYEIDLNSKNAGALRKHLDKYVTSARRTHGTPKKSPKRSTKRSGPSPSEVRAWAAENGVEVSPTGRVPKAVVEQYLATQ